MTDTKPKPVERNIRNTFAPRVGNEFLDIHEVIMGLQFGFIDAKNLPDEVRAQLPRPRFNDDKSPIKFKAHKNEKTEMGQKSKEQRTGRLI